MRHAPYDRLVAVRPAPHVAQQRVDAGLLHDGVHLRPLGEDQAHTLGDHVDDAPVVALLPDAPVDHDGRPASGRADAGGDVAVALVDLALMGDGESDAGIAPQAFGQRPRGDGVEQPPVLLLLRCRHRAPVAADDRARHEVDVEGVVQHLLEAGQLDVGIGPRGVQDGRDMGAHPLDEDAGTRCRGDGCAAPARGRHRDRQGQRGCPAEDATPPRVRPIRHRQPPGP